MAVWNSTRLLHRPPNQPTSIYTKANFDQTSWRTYSLVKASADLQRPLKRRTKPRGVNKDKMDALCRNLLGLVPSHKRAFWTELQNSAKANVRDVLG